MMNFVIRTLVVWLVRCLLPAEVIQTHRRFMKLRSSYRFLRVHRTLPNYTHRVSADQTISHEVVAFKLDPSVHMAVREWLLGQNRVEGKDFQIREYAGAAHNEAAWRDRLDVQLLWLLSQ